MLFRKAVNRALIGVIGMEEVERKDEGCIYIKMSEKSWVRGGKYKK
jgi:hypothetical protein